MFEVAFEQELFAERLSVLIGRIAAAGTSTVDDFLGLPLAINFLNPAVGFNGIPANIPGFSFYPGATWGARLRFTPSRAWSVAAGVYNSAANPLDPSDSNLLGSALGRSVSTSIDFSFDGEVFLITELTYKHHPDAAGPGVYKISAYYDSSRFLDLTNPFSAGSRGNHGFYILAEQMVYRESHVAPRQGLTPFVGVIVAPSKRRNLLPLYIKGGLIYQGLFARRDYDITTFGVTYARFNSDIPGLGDRYWYEWTHLFVVTAWLMIRPDIQYIVHPGGTGQIDNVLAFGTQFILTF